ncbi:MAG: ECF transporter S component [Clostridia bacterium]|nr:ECF transporter S component [Clostridia bacterium]
MSDQKVRKLAMGGVMAALVFVMTYLPKVPVPVTGGYVHLGDGMVFLAAMLLGPMGVAASAVGSALSDLVGGYMTYLIPTFLIKGAMALVAWKLWKPGNWLRTAVAFILAEAVMVAGYFAFEAVLYGVPAALGAVGPNAIQGMAGVIVGLLCATLVPRLKAVAK